LSAQEAKAKEADHFVQGVRPAGLIMAAWRLSTAAMASSTTGAQSPIDLSLDFKVEEEGPWEVPTGLAPAPFYKFQCPSHRSSHPQPEYAGNFRKLELSLLPSEFSC